MKLERLPYDSRAVLEFYAETLGALGAVAEQTWHDRLEVLAEGDSAKIWKEDGGLHSAELHFAAADATEARDAAREVFPGCPLTFRLAEALLGPLAGLSLERLVLARDSGGRPPEPAVAEKHWRAQHPRTGKWRLASDFRADHHFSLVALARCEIQAIDQHWSMHRLAVSLASGETDEHLAQAIAFAQAERETTLPPAWPQPDPARWGGLLRSAIEQGLAAELAGIRARQEASLRRELDRIDSYFEDYTRELQGRARRGDKESGQAKFAERLAAAAAEHSRRRADQIARHEIRVLPRIDALLLVAEPAWRAQVQTERDHQSETASALYVPRLRRWAA